MPNDYALFPLISDYPGGGAAPVTVTHRPEVIHTAAQKSLKKAGLEPVSVMPVHYALLVDFCSCPRKRPRGIRTADTISVVNAHNVDRHIGI